VTLKLFRSYLVRASFGSQIVAGIVLAAACCGTAQAQKAVYGTQTSIGSNLNCVQDVAVDSSGNLYVVDYGENCTGVNEQSTLFKETLQPNGTYVQSIIPTSTIFYTFGFYSVAVDSKGNVFVSDESNDRVIEESPNGTGYTESTLLAPQVSTPQGTIEPAGIAVDTHDNVYITDYNNWQVLKETFNGTTYTQSIIIPAGYGNPLGISAPTGVAIDSAGNLYLCDARSNLSEYIYSGGTYTKSTTFPAFFAGFPPTVTLDGAGNFYVPGTKYNLSNGTYIPSLIGLDAQSGTGMAIDNLGDIFVTGGIFGNLLKLTTPLVSAGSVNLGSSGTATLTFTFDQAGSAGVGVVVRTQGSTGSLDFTDAGTGTCDTNGTAHVYAINDSCTVVVNFTPQATGVRTGVAQLIETIGYGNGVVFASGFVSGTGAGPLVGFGYATPVTVATTGVTSPAGLAVDAAGDVFLSTSPSTGNGILEETFSGGTYTGSSVLSTAYFYALSHPSGMALDNAGDFYVADTGNNRILEGQLNIGSYIPSNNLAIGTGLSNPKGVAVDGLGLNVYIADTGNNRIVQDTLVGSNLSGSYSYGQTVLSAITGLSSPSGIALDVSGNLYIADTGNNRVLLETQQPYVPTTNLGAPENPPASSVYVQTVVASAGLSAPQGVFVDGQGNVFIADTGNNRILKESLVGGAYVESVVPTTGMTLSGPTAVWVDGSHTVYIADTGNNRVIKIPISTTPPSLTFASTAVGSTSTDSPQTVTVTNIGSTPLTISIPTSGTNPSLSSSTNFTLTTTGSTACPSISSTSAVGTIAPNATCTLPFSFSPGQSGSDTATLTFTDNNGNTAGATQVIDLAGTGTAPSSPSVMLNPTNIAFGNETVSTPTAATTVTLSNPGTATLNIAGISITGTGSANFAIVNNNCGTTLAMSGSCTLGVTFTPATATGYTAALSFSDNAGASPQTVPLTGTGIATAPAVTLTPSVAFGNQGEGTVSGLKSLTLSNTGNATLNISSITIGGANPTNFTKDPSTTCGTTLAQSTNCTIYVSFSPTTTTTYSAIVSVADNATGTPHAASLMGTGTYVTPTVTLLPSPVPFGSIVQGNKSTSQTVTLTNTGTSPYNISSYGVSDSTDYTYTTTCGSVVQPEGTCTFSVTLQPASIATLNATLNVNDTTDSVNVSASLTGAGISAAAPVASITTPVAFGNQTINTTSAAQTLILSNTGNAALTITGITIGGANPTFFTHSGGTCGTSLAASSTCTILVTFTPATVTTYSATVSIADNAAGSPQVATLTGAGVVPTDFGVTATTPSGSVPNGSVAQFTIDVAALSGSFTNPVVMSVTGLPAGATASFNPAAVTPGSAGATTALSVQTPSLLARDNSNTHTIWFAGLLLLPLLAMKRMRRKLARMPAGLRALLLFAIGLGMLLPLTGCGGGFFGPMAHTSTLTITGTSGAVQHSTTVTLTVQ
jgi:sugar lactone lactonase YvrE